MSGIWAAPRAQCPRLAWNEFCLVFVSSSTWCHFFWNPFTRSLTNCVRHMAVNISFSSVSRLVSGHSEQWRCVCIWRSSAVLCRGSEIPLRKQCNPQTAAGQQLYWCGSETHPEALCCRRHQLHYGRAHPCTGVSQCEQGWVKFYNIL